MIFADNQHNQDCMNIDNSHPTLDGFSILKLYM